jgi:muramidase (phage lysozyme)
MSAAGSFMSGFANSYQFQKDRAEEKARDEQDWKDRAAARDYERNQRTQARSIEGGDGSAGSTSDAWGSDARPMLALDPANAEMPAHQRAFLNGISAGESGGKYNVRYSPKGGVNFDLNGQHPQVYEPGPHGPSSAAGRYQFTWTTWRDIAGKDTPFTEKNQDIYAWKLAERDYKINTGRSLDEDLQKNGMTNDIMEVLTPTWQALKGNRGKWAATYDDSLRRYNTPAPTTAAPARSIAPQPTLGYSFGVPADTPTPIPSRRI